MKKIKLIVALFAICMGTVQAQFLVSDFNDVVGDGGGGDGSQGSGFWNFASIAAGTGIVNVAIAGGSEDVVAGQILRLDADLSGVISTTTGISVTFYDGLFNTIGAINFSGGSSGVFDVTMTESLTAAAGALISPIGTGSTGSPVELRNLEVVPEPSSFALMGLGMGALYLLRRRK